MLLNFCFSSVHVFYYREVSAKNPEGQRGNYLSPHHNTTPHNHHVRFGGAHVCIFVFKGEKLRECDVYKISGNLSTLFSPSQWYYHYMAFP